MIGAFGPQNFLKAWKHKGVECAMYYSPFGSVNGYVRDPRLLSSSERGWDLDLEAPGGITYGPDPEGWIGFDTLHAGDIWPLDFLKRHHSGPIFSDMCAVERQFPSPHQVHWSTARVYEAVERLAEQTLELQPVLKGEVVWRRRPRG
jgi:hypothetical protein